MQENINHTDCPYGFHVSNPGEADEEAIGTELNKGQKLWLSIHNNGTQNIKHMLTQRWAYYYLHRSDDMITNPFSWDKVLPTIDSPSTVMSGLQPKETSENLLLF